MPYLHILAFSADLERLIYCRMRPPYGTTQRTQTVALWLPHPASRSGPFCFMGCTAKENRATVSRDSSRTVEGLMLATGECAISIFFTAGQRYALRMFFGYPRQKIPWGTKLKVGDWSNVRRSRRSLIGRYTGHNIPVRKRARPKLYTVGFDLIVLRKSSRAHLHEQHFYCIWKKRLKLNVISWKT